MNDRDRILALIDNGLLNAEDALRDVLVNYFDIDKANDCAEWLLSECGYDD